MEFKENQTAHGAGSEGESDVKCKIRKEDRGVLSLALLAVKAALRIVWCFIHIFTFIPVYMIAVFIVWPLRVIWPRLYWGIEGNLYRWLGAHVAYWGYTAGYQIYEYGEELPKWDERCLVIVNHQTTADVPTIMAVLQGKDKGSAFRKALWVMASEFRWSPFGIMSQVHGDHFIRQGKAVRDQELQSLARHLEKVFWDRDRRWVIVFPEGGFLYKLRKKNREFAAKNGYTVLDHLTLPRVGAVKTILESCGDNGAAGNGRERSKSDPEQIPVKEILTDALGAIREKKYVKETRPPIKYVLDITIAYPDSEDAPGLHHLASGVKAPQQIHVYYQRFLAKDVPFESGEEALREWLYGVWEQKEKLLGAFYSTGVFAWGEEGRPLTFPWWKIILQQLCFGGAVLVFFRWLHPALHFLSLAIHRSFSFFF